MRKASVLCLAAVSVLLSLAPTNLCAKDPRLTRAWNEYRFQSYATAVKLFEEVKEAAVDKTDRQEAAIGLAMIAQFREKGGDVESAREIYEELIEERIEGEPGILVKSLLAESCAALGEMDTANALWDELIAGNPASIVAQDALLRRTMVNMKFYDDPESREAVTYLKKKRTAFPEPSPETPGLAPPTDRILAEFFFWNKEYEKAREFFVRYIDIGLAETIGYEKRARALYRVARMFETIFNDPVSAARYYRLLALETPSDQRSYYGIEKAVELGAISADELRNMKFSGITEEIIRELVAKKEQ